METTFNIKENKEKHELLNRNKIEHTPFDSVTVKEKGSFIALGHYRLTEYYNSEEEALKEIEFPNWNTIVSLVVATTHAIEPKK